MLLRKVKVHISHDLTIPPLDWYAGKTLAPGHKETVQRTFVTLCAIAKYKYYKQSERS